MELHQCRIGWESGKGSVPGVAGHSPSCPGQWAQPHAARHICTVLSVIVFGFWMILGGPGNCIH